MHYNVKKETWRSCNLNSLKLSSQHLSQFWHRFFFPLQLFLELSFGLLLITSYSSLALTSKTSNKINGNVPYLTFDGGRTRVTNTDGLLGISLSDGKQFSPTSNSSNLSAPIELPEAGQSFVDIAMFVPTNKSSITLSSLIGPPHNFWGDDDGDGQGVNGIIATGSLRLSIVDKNNRTVARDEVLTICKAPYKLTLSNTEGLLRTRYGVPNESRFSANNVTYYINPKALPVICFAKPDLTYSIGDFAGPAAIWDPNKGFLSQSVMPSSYSLNFPTTGANDLYFDLDIGGSSDLSWASVSHGGITATMTNLTNSNVRVTLTGPVATKSQWKSDDPGYIDRPSLPQVFELVGRDSHGNDVVKYGFVLKQWFVNRGDSYKNNYHYDSTLSWCTNIGYRLPNVRDLTNASCQDETSNSKCQGAKGATPSSPKNLYQRRIGAGFFSEWGAMYNYTDAHFVLLGFYWTSDVMSFDHFLVHSGNGYISSSRNGKLNGLCVSP